MRPEYKFHSFDTSNGLPDNSVQSIGQDKDGYIWLGTRNGLSRFDGKKFISYRYKEGDPSQVASNDIRAILVDGDSIWVGNSNGLLLFDIHEKTFSVCSYPVSVNKKASQPFGTVRQIIKVASNVYVLGADRNIYKNTGDKLFSSIGLKPKNWYSISTYFNKYILAHGCDGLSLIDPATASIISRYPENAEDLSLDLFFDEKRKLAFVSFGMHKEMKVYRITGDNKIIPADNSTLPYSDLTSSYDGNILFGTNGRGLIADNEDGIKIYDTSENLISGDVITSIFTDNDNNLWVGTYRYGLNLYSPRFSWISNYPVSDKGLSNRLATAVMVKDDVMYVGTDGGGMDIIDLRSKIKTNYKKSPGGIIGDAVLSMIEEPDCLWLGCYSDGLSKYDFKTATFESYPYKDKSIWSIADDGIGRIWVIGKDASLFDKAKGTFQVIPGLENIWGYGVKFVGDEAWIYTGKNGIYVIDMASMKVKAVHNIKTGLPSDAVTFMYVDSNNNKWIGFRNSGLYVSKAGMSLNEVQQVNDMDANSIMTMVERDGDIWIATDNGLFRYDTEKKHFSRFGKENGLGSVQFLNSSFDSEGGDFYFGTTQGVIKVDVDKIKYAAVKPVHINSLTLIHNDSIIPVPVNNYKIKLAHDENFFSIGFSQPEFVSPESMSFSCRLKGFDREWRNLENLRQVVYTNVPPGDYVFEVRSKDWDGSWCEPSAVLYIKIRCPWYKEWWAIMIWTILAAAVIYGCHYAYSYNRLIRKKFRTRLRDMIDRLQKAGRVRAIEIREIESTSEVQEEGRLMKEIIETIENNISDSNYSIDDLSRHVSISRTKLYKIIQDETGRTPAVLIRDIRLKQSARMLLTTDLNISEISVKVGFGSLKYFNKYFKETFGVTPSVYRENKGEVNRGD